MLRPNIRDKTMSSAPEERRAAARAAGYDLRRLCRWCAHYNPYWRVIALCPDCQRLPGAAEFVEAWRHAEKSPAPPCIEGTS